MNKIASVALSAFIVTTGCDLVDVPVPFDSSADSGPKAEASTDSGSIEAEAGASIAIDSGNDALDDGPDSATDGPSGTGSDATVEAGCAGNTASACGPQCVACSSGQICFLGVCGCSTSDGCPVGQSCNPTSHTCSTACDGINTVCNGGCCINANCAPGTTQSACGASGLKCATSCQLSACEQVQDVWGGGSCECAQDSHCNGDKNGRKCVGISGGTGACGCLTDLDCGGFTCKIIIYNGVTLGYGHCQ